MSDRSLPFSCGHHRYLKINQHHLQGAELTELAVPEPQKSTSTVSSGTVPEPVKATDYLIR
jgi:hypothetical protein